MLRLIQDVKSPWFGVNLDTGNFHGEDPYDDLAKIAPYAINVQVKVVVSGLDGKRMPADFKRLDLWKDSKTYLMPVETLVYHRSVCGVVVFRYRWNALSVVGEFATTCWRKEATGHGGDPFKDLKIIRDDAGNLVRVESIDDRGPRVYRWDATKQAFLSTHTKALPPRK